MWITDESRSIEFLCTWTFTHVFLNLINFKSTIVYEERIQLNLTQIIFNTTPSSNDIAYQDKTFMRWILDWKSCLFQLLYIEVRSKVGYKFSSKNWGLKAHFLGILGEHKFWLQFNNLIKFLPVNFCIFQKFCTMSLYHRTTLAHRGSGIDSRLLVSVCRQTEDKHLKSFINADFI